MVIPIGKRAAPGRAWTALRAVLAIGLVTAAVRGIEWLDLARSWEAIWWVPLAGAVALRFVVLAARAWRWSILMAHEGKGREVGALTRILVKAEPFNSLMPSTAGGDMYRVLATKSSRGTPAATAAVLADRALGMVTLVAAALVVLLLTPWVRDTHVGLVVGLVAATVLGGIAPVWLGRGKIRRWLQAQADAGGSSRRAVAFTQILRYYRALEQYADRPRQLATALALSLLPVGGVIVTTYLLCLSVAALPQALDLISVALTVSVISLLPIFVNGLGGREAAFIVMFQHVGVEAHQAALIALLSRAVWVVTAIIGGLVYLYDSSKAPRANTETAEGPPAQVEYPASWATRL